MIAVLGAHLVVLLFIAWQILHFGQYIRRVCRLVIAGMDCDELIDELMSVGAGAGLAEGGYSGSHPGGRNGGDARRAGGPGGRTDVKTRPSRRGPSRQYGLVVHGKAFTADQIDALDNSEIEKLYARYA